MALFILAQIVGTMIQDRHIGIPFDVIYFGIVSHQFVHYVEHEILYLRITQVEYHLSTSPSQYQVTFRCFDHPIRMLFIQFTLSVRHFRLYPDTKSDTLPLSLIYQPSNTRRQFLLIHHPVAQRSVVGLARIFVTKPAVVHHKKFTAHRRNIRHHLLHTAFVDFEIDTFPTVQQNLSELVAIS